MTIRRGLEPLSIAFVAAALFATACTSSRTASFDDARIEEEVAGALRADHIDGIAVSVKAGCVTLTGIVATRAERDEASSIAERVPGVISIANQIEVSGQKS
jgi:osmotically-inducible protein OsmY